MIEGDVVDTFRLRDNFVALDETGNYTIFNSDKKMLAYRSQTVNGLGLYKFRANLVGAKRFFLANMKRQDKIIYGNSFYHKYKRGLYNDIIYFDFRSYYAKIFEQIADHIDEEYFGKIISSIARRNIYLKQMKTNGVDFSKEAMKKDLVEIDDIARHSIKIDLNDKTEIKSMVTSLSDAKFADTCDSRVSKITRNALVFGFGYQQKNARINNISALVMFFAKEMLQRTIEELKNIGGYETIFSHTDSLMIGHFNTKDVDQAIRSASGLVDAEFFGNTEIISMGFNNINTKGKFEDLMILNQNSYISSVIAPRGKREVNLKIAGLNTLSECDVGIDEKGESIQDLLFNNMDKVFSWDKIPGDEKDFLYGLLKYRLAKDYDKSIREKWLTKDKSLYEKAVIVSKTIKHVNLLKEINAPR